MPPLVQALKDYDRLRRRRFHVPAHAGQNFLVADPDVLNEPYRYDLTELDGLDVLSEPSGCIQKAQERAAKVFGVAHSYFLVNGASVGLMAAMLATIKPGEKVLLARNVHRSVLSGLILCGAEPIWFLPERLTDWGLWGAVTVETVKAQIDAHPDIKALFITSPTYEGIGSDIAALAQLCRERSVLLVVDEAHGGLWPFSDQLPTSACEFACDAVIHSMHKTGGSLTQSALAHLPYGSRIDPTVFQQALNTLQTTSPSYLLMASLDNSVHYLISRAGQDRIRRLMKQVASFRVDLLSRLQQFRLFSPAPTMAHFCDPCKLYFTHPKQAGEAWGADFEERHQVAYESASPDGVLYLANLGLELEDFETLREVLLTEDAQRLGDSSPISVQTDLETENPSVLLPEMAMSPREAFFAPGCRIASQDTVGRIAKETIVHCPPGIPVLFPGEKIQQAHLPYLPDGDVLVIAEGHVQSDALALLDE